MDWGCFPACCLVLARFFELPDYFQIPFRFHQITSATFQVCNPIPAVQHCNPIQVYNIAYPIPAVQLSGELQIPDGPHQLPILPARCTSVLSLHVPARSLYLWIPNKPSGSRWSSQRSEVESRSLKGSGLLSASRASQSSYRPTSSST